MSPDRLSEFLELVESRRSNPRVDPRRPVPEELVRRICGAARWAPCHRRTWPWRFGRCAGDERLLLGDAVADALEREPLPGERPPGRFRTKYLRAPTVLVVGSARDADPVVDRENRDAVACAVQNVLLAATAAGVESFWSSCPERADAAIGRLFGWGDPVQVVAIVSLGWPVAAADVPLRPAVELRSPQSPTNDP